MSYIILIAMLVVVFNMNKKDVYFEFLIALTYILNSILRMYFFKENKKNIFKYGLFTFSVIIDVIIILYYKNIIGEGALILTFITILDISLFYKRYESMLIVLGINILVGVIAFNNKSNSVFINMFLCGSLAIYSVLSYYLKELDSKKNQAHDLYDRLRISEEKLIKANNELKSYSNTVEELAILRERTRVSRELHDSVGHALSTLCIQLKAVETIFINEPELAKNMLGKNITYVENALESIRRTVRKLKPKELEVYDGIMAMEKMIKSFEEKTGIKVRFIVSKEKWSLHSEQCHNLYRILQEGLSNSLKHGKANNITVSMQFLKEKLYVNIKDDGIGDEKVSSSFGLQGISERVKEMDGTVEYYTEKEKGFSISLTIPKINYID
ncbi:sensor histidine kinase [Oceanirhabdus sp. W0125-5]|uniref:sensor histidine kinase n=1 Tax=Oceanirhabdus sp. W0125-5 TaxID=2999116 RepID=UPI0022F328D4|nr:sensor histidine kinase [Oceanirhabdus sp. W0125-5]WBW97179.1 sensor histidine kinase [Oceanirhabdus sp. W0125-5]